MKQKQFNKILYDFGKSDLEPNKAWTAYLKCLTLFKDNNKNTTEYLEQLGLMTDKQKLVWRTKLAEKGIELTPSQVDDYILIISLAVMKSWGLH